MIGVGAGDNVALPAYNCRAIVEPVEWLRADPRRYPVNPDLSFDLDAVRRLCDARTRALIVIHYFGFPQNLTEIREYCDQHGIALIEDCAHAFFGAYEGRAPGSVGDYAIGSVLKFFPVYDGGCLVSARHSVGTIRTRRGDWKFEFKALLNMVEEAIEYARLRPFNWLLGWSMELKDRIWRTIKQQNEALRHQDFGPGSSHGVSDFDDSWLDVRISVASNLVLRGTSAARIIRNRRENFLFLLGQLGNLENCRPLHQDLPAGVVPYVFPLVIEDPDTAFPELKRRGIPMFRWEEVIDGECDTSSRYSRALLQIPCHQELRKGELEWIACQIRQVVG